MSIASFLVCEASWLLVALPHPAFALLASLAAAPALLSSAPDLLCRRLLIGTGSKRTFGVVGGVRPVAVDALWRALVGGAVTGWVGVLLMLG